MYLFRKSGPNLLSAGVLGNSYPSEERAVSTNFSPRVEESVSDMCHSIIEVLLPKWFWVCKHPWSSMTPSCGQVLLASYLACGICPKTPMSSFNGEITCCNDLSAIFCARLTMSTVPAARSQTSFLKCGVVESLYENNWSKPDFPWV